LGITALTTITPVAVPSQINCDVNSDPCGATAATNLANQNAITAYNAEVAAAIATFTAQYYKQCMPNPNNFEYYGATYTDQVYHYTLYYYDQAGNLVRTVAPRDVAGNTLPLASLGTVDAYRNDPSSGYYPFTVPTYSVLTNYQYNTLNEVIQQSTPDAGVTNFWYSSVGQLRVSQNPKQAAHTLGSGFTQLFDPYYSYIKYDALGRTVEVGESDQYSYLITTGQYPFNDPVNLNNPTFPVGVDQISSTVYDIAYNPPGLTQLELRKRVSYNSIDENGDGIPEYSTYYSYDPMGNVLTVMQDNPQLSDLPNQEFKRVDYEFELISGNVLSVNYQTGQYDQFHHKYWYDKDNRLTNVYTSADGIIWDQDAKYFYYLHGPLARTELGDDKVQGLDYFYTINGWVKGVNSNTINPNFDLGKDGSLTAQYDNSQPGIHQNIAQDAFGFTLGYYDDGTLTGQNDYKAINASVGSNLTSNEFNSLQYTSSNLFNGNIKDVCVAMLQPSMSGGIPTYMPLMKKEFRYDQLNRITQANAFISGSGSNSSPISGYYGALNNGDYQESFNYDPNGNILALNRNASGGNGYSGPGQTVHQMDQLSYQYQLNPSNGLPTNQLSYVGNAQPTNKFASEVNSQSAGTGSTTAGYYSYDNNNTGNYTYDLIGNLFSDKQNQISSIGWTNYGKVSTVNRSTGSTMDDLEFHYDANGHRVCKIVKRRPYGAPTSQDNWDYTYYVNDPSGHVLATYEKTYTVLTGGVGCSSGSLQIVESLTKKEHMIYGIKRLGEKNYQATIYNSNSTSLTEPTVAFQVFCSSGAAANGIFPNDGGSINVFVTPATITSFMRWTADKTYELTNHLGNVQVTINDKKLPVQGSMLGFAQNYLPDVVSQTDYYAFGSQIDSRSSYLNIGTGKYRYGMNGQEKDDEIANITGGHYSAEYWEYDARLGRRWNVDPETANAPEESPYAGFKNCPTMCTDPNGDNPLLLAVLGAGIGFVQEFASEIGEYVIDNRAHGRKGLNAFHHVLQKLDWADLVSATVTGALEGFVGGGALSASVKSMLGYALDELNTLLQTNVDYINETTDDMELPYYKRFRWTLDTRQGDYHHKDLTKATLAFGVLSLPNGLHWLRHAPYDFSQDPLSVAEAVGISASTNAANDIFLDHKDYKKWHNGFGRFSEKTMDVMDETFHKIGKRFHNFFSGIRDRFKSLKLWWGKNRKAHHKRDNWSGVHKR